MESLLTNLTKADVRTDPFPHIVARGLLEDGVVRRLIEEFPPSEVVAQGRELGDNRRHSYSAGLSLQDDRVSPLWKEFIRAHVSHAYYEKYIDLFHDYILAAYPGFKRSVGSFSALRVGVRNRDNFENADILLDAQIALNTPVVAAPSSVRTMHVDDPRKFLTGLFYLRLPEDDSKGGDLVLYRYRGNRRHFRGQQIDERYGEVVSTVRYERNVLVLFVNSVDALHGVTVREITPHRRLFLNLVGEVRDPIFDLSQYRESIAVRALRKFGFLPRSFGSHRK